MTLIQYQTEADGIVHLVLDRPDASANLIDRAFTDELSAAVERLQQTPDLTGVILRSNKSTFVAGGDLNLLSQVTEENQDQVLELLNSLKASFRALERLHKPVVACIEGSALGGGLELALASSHRIVVDDPGIRLGLPEVTLGLLPGAGGVSRLVRMLGLEAALPLLTEGRLLSPEQAESLGIVDARVTDADSLLDRARDWIKANPEVTAPWDQKGFRLPGGSPSQPKVAQMLSVAPAMIRCKTQGCYPAPLAVLASAVEGASLGIDAAGRIENRYFLPLVTGQVSKNLIQTLFFEKNAIESNVSRPATTATPEPVARVGILGAGMMGAGIAWACAIRGVGVALLDVTPARAERGKAYSERLARKRIEQGRWSREQSQTLLDAIHPTDDYAELADCDLIIEAVFEDAGLKAEVTQMAEEQAKFSAILASNTSTLPITSLAEAVSQPERFVGMHFFSPVDKMPLVEIICGRGSSEASVARAYDFVRQIGKTPIVVNDSRGFFTSRVFRTYTYEGLAMLNDGVTAAEIENAAWLAGFPVGPLAVMDEVSLGLMRRVRDQTRQHLASENKVEPHHPGDATLDRMLDLERMGKAAGVGFYDYPEGGRKRLWPGLAEQFSSQPERMPLADLRDRLLYIQALETARIWDEGVLRRVGDANLGSILGLGYPAWTGGVLQFINQTGLTAFVERARQLAERYGERFIPPASLIERAQRSQPYQDKRIAQ